MESEISQWKQRLWSLKGGDDFNELALSIFHYQVSESGPYLDFCTSLGRLNPKDVSDIPFLPISAFKSHQILSGAQNAEIQFKSSGTTDSIKSRHHVADLSVYESSFMHGFTSSYGAPQDCCILALLPSYLERSGSSLVYMANKLIEVSGHADSGFYLDDLASLHQKLQSLKENGTKTILLGVSFALLDMAEDFPIDFPELIVMETGGMKGRKKELTREALHGILQNGFGVPQVHSEYGMTELLSQAYSSGGGRFTTPPWMRVSARQIDDPFSEVNTGRTGGLNIIDLANIHSCSFIATDDLGRIHEDGTFEVLGRYDVSDIRGCSLLIS